MEWKIWITWLIIFWIRYSRLFWVHYQKNETVTDNPSISVNEIENRIIFKIKKGYYFQLLTHVTKKLLGSTKSKITRDENSKNMPHLEITEVVLVHCNIVKNDYQHNLRTLHTFVRNKSFGQLLDISHKKFIFKNL